MCSYKAVSKVNTSFSSPHLPPQSCPPSCIQSSQWITPAGTSLAQVAEVMPFLPSLVPTHQPQPSFCFLTVLSLFPCQGLCMCHPLSSRSAYGCLLLISEVSAQMSPPGRGLPSLHQSAGLLSLTLHPIILITMYPSNVFIVFTVHLHLLERKLHENRDIICVVHYHMHSTWHNVWHVGGAQ